VGFYILLDKEEKKSSSVRSNRTFNIKENRVAIVSSVIAKIFNPGKCWMVTIQLSLNDSRFNQCLLLLLPVTYCPTFVCFSALIRFNVY
jgi:hypothetical protein